MGQQLSEANGGLREVPALNAGQINMVDDEVAIFAGQLFAALLAHRENFHGFTLGA